MVVISTVPTMVQYYLRLLERTILYRPFSGRTLAGRESLWIHLPDSDLFDIHHVARSMLLHKKVVPSYKDGHGFFKVQSLPFEPYHQLSSSSVCQLLNPVMTDQPVPAPLLHEVRKLCRHSKVDSLVYKELREHLDRLSLFVGRNPLVSSVAVL